MITTLIILLLTRSSSSKLIILCSSLSENKKGVIHNYLETKINGKNKVTLKIYLDLL